MSEDSIRKNYYPLNFFFICCCNIICFFNLNNSGGNVSREDVGWKCSYVADISQFEHHVILYWDGIIMGEIMPMPFLVAIHDNCESLMTIICRASYHNCWAYTIFI